MKIKDWQLGDGDGNGHRHCIRLQQNSGSTSESDDYSGQTITGEVTVVDGDDITIALGEIKEAEDSSSESEDDNSGESEPTEATDTSR